MNNILKKIGEHFREKQYHYVCGVITLVLLTMGVLCFSHCIGRLGEACRDFGLSVAYAFCNWLDIEAEITPTVNDYSVYIFADFNPLDWEMLKIKWVEYWTAFIDRENIILYLYYVVSYSSSLLPIVMFSVPLYFGLKKLFNKYYMRESKKAESEDEKADETRPIEHSKSLRGWHWLYFTVIIKIERWFVGLYDFIKEHKELWQLWLVLLCLYFNVATIFLEFVAYYVYFAISFDLINIYRQVYKLLVDLTPLFSMFGAVSWITIFILALRKKSDNLAFEQVEPIEVENDS